MAWMTAKIPYEHEAKMMLVIDDDVMSLWAAALSTDFKLQAPLLA